MRILCTFSSNMQFFIIIDLSWAQILRYFLNFRKCAYESLLQLRNTLQKSEIRFCEVLRIRCTFHQNSILKHHFWPNFRPRCWDIFSISGNALMNPFFSIVISCEKAINDCVRFCGSDAPFIKDSIFHNFWRKFTPRFKDIFSISGNKLMNYFFSIVISCQKAKYDCVSLCGNDTPFHQIQFFIIFYPNLGPDFEIFSQFQEMRLWIPSSAS